MAKIQIEVLEEKCPECESNIESRTKKGLLSTKSWLECPNCGKKWPTRQEYDREIEELNKRLKELEELREIEKTGALPIVILDTNLVLKKNEFIHHYESPVTLMEERSRTYTYRSQSMGFRLKVAKGVYITPRVGGGSIKKKETVIEEIDSGELYLTSQRLIFVGNKKTLTIPLRKIFAVEPFENAIKIGREGKQRAEYFTTNEPLKWATFLKVAISRL